MAVVIKIAPSDLDVVENYLYETVEKEAKEILEDGSLQIVLTGESSGGMDLFCALNTGGAPFVGWYDGDIEFGPGQESFSPTLDKQEEIVTDFHQEPIANVNSDGELTCPDQIQGIIDYFIVRKQAEQDILDRIKEST